MTDPADDALSRAMDQVRKAELDGEEQRDLRERILEFCAQHADALHRSCIPGHLTGSAAIYDPSRHACLALHHVKLNRWLQPGGHADGDGDLQAVALREAEEETGVDGLQVIAPAIDVDIHTIPARSREPEHLHLDVRYLVLCPAGAQPKGNHESHALAWWTPGGSVPSLDDSTQRLFNRAINYLP